MLSKGHVLLDVGLTHCNQIEHASTEPARKFVVEPEIEFV